MVLTVPIFCDTINLLIKYPYYVLRFVLATKIKGPDREAIIRVSVGDGVRPS